MPKGTRLQKQIIDRSFLLLDIQCLSAASYPEYIRYHKALNRFFHNSDPPAVRELLHRTATFLSRNVDQGELAKHVEQWLGFALSPESLAKLIMMAQPLSFLVKTGIIFVTSDIIAPPDDD